MKNGFMQKIVAYLLLAIAIGFLIAGGTVVRYKVYDADTEEFGLATFTRLSDRDLVTDTTFSGVERRDLKLYSTYDRTAPRGKRSCPT